MIKSAEGGKPLKKAPFLALVAVIVLLIGMWPPWPAGSQTTGITSQTQVVNSTAAAGTSSIIALDGKYSNCTVIAQTSTSTASVVVYGNTQATQYGPAAPNAVNSNFGSSGTITATTTQSQTSGNVANLPVGFYFTWSGNSGTLYAWAVCSSAIARAAAGATGAPGPTGPTGPPGPTGSPGAVPTFTASAPLAVSTGSNTVTYTCSTCSTGGAVPSFSASPPIVVATPAGQVNASINLGPCFGVSGSNLVLTCVPTCVASVCSTNQYVPTVLAETSATHFWEMNDSPGGSTPGPCPSTITDAIAGGATAAPSPVVLTVITSPMPSPAGSPLTIECGVAGPIKNGNTAIAFRAVNIASYLTVPNSVFQTLCNASGGSCIHPFTVECIVSLGNAAYYASSGNNFIWSIDTTSHDFLSIKGSGGGDSSTWEGDSKSFGQAGSGTSVMVDWETDNTDTYLFLNGQLAAAPFAGVGDITASSLSFFGWDGVNAGINFFNGRMQGCSTYNTALSLSALEKHYAATGLP